MLAAMSARFISSIACLCALLLGPSAPAALAQATPKVSIADASIAEGDSGLTNLDFPITLSRVPTERVTVAFATTNGGSAFGAPPFPEASDFVPTSGTVTFEPGDTLAFARVQVRGDLFHEANENIPVTLSNATGATIDRGQAEGFIVNDDALPELSISDAGAVEGAAARFTLTLSRPSLSSVSVDITTRDGTASAALGDFVPLSRRVTFLSRRTSGTIDVQTVRDSDGGGLEVFFVDLTNADGATIADGVGTGLIFSPLVP